MATRPKIPKSTETDLLTQSRRRCAFCCGLSGDYSEKRGQIAHVDRDPRNNALSNLAWLCLFHHDQYDSKSSQSKNLTTAELIEYREVLYSHWTKSLSANDGQVMKIVVSSAECAAVSWTSKSGLLCGIEFEIEAVIQPLREPSALDLVINGDWDYSAYTCVNTAGISSSIRRPENASRVISVINAGNSAVLSMSFRRAYSGSYIESTSITYDPKNNVHRREGQTLFCKYGIEEIGSVAIWSIGGTYSVDSNFMLRKRLAG